MATITAAGAVRAVRRFPRWGHLPGTRGGDRTGRTRRPRTRLPAAGQPLPCTGRRRPTAAPPGGSTSRARRSAALEHRRRARLHHQLHQTGLLAGGVLDADVLDVDARPRPASAKIRASSPGRSLMSTATVSYDAGAGAVLAGHPDPAGVAAPQDVLDARGAAAPLVLVGGLQARAAPSRSRPGRRRRRRARRRPGRGWRRGSPPTSGGRRRRSGSRRGCPGRTGVRRSRRRPPAGRRPCRRSAAGCGRRGRRRGRGRRRP